MQNSHVIGEDANKLLKYMDSERLDASTEVVRGAKHMGALIVESAMQRRRQYKSIVAPGVAAVREQWPDADTTDRFIAHLNNNDIYEVFGAQGREQQMLDTAEVLRDSGIQTVDEFRERLADEGSRYELRSALRKVTQVGPKTLDYFDILCGLNTSTAIDSRIRRAAKRAGITSMGYDHLVAVLRTAASIRGWRVGDLDAVLWANHAN